MEKVEGDGDDDREESDASSEEDNNVVESMLHQTQGQKMAGEDAADARFIEEETKCVQALDRAATMFKQSEGEEVETLGDMPEPVTADEPELVIAEQEEVHEEESKE